jgi:predicted nucleic acid-binding protein
MRVMIDTTVFLAECLLPTQKYPRLMRKIVAGHKLVLSEGQLEEIRSLMAEYFPNECDTVELFLSRFSFETAESTEDRQEGYPFLSDARAAGVDAVITLDPDMAGTVTDGIRFMSPDSFLNGD